MLCCSACHNAFYCSQDCQKAAWKKHKPQCALKVVETMRDANLVAFAALLAAASDRHLVASGLLLIKKMQHALCLWVKMGGHFSAEVDIHILLIRIFALITQTREVEGSAILVDSVFDCRIALATHLKKACTLIQTHSLSGFDGEIREMQELVQQKTELISRFEPDSYRSPGTDFPDFPDLPLFCAEESELPETGRGAAETGGGPTQTSKGAAETGVGGGAAETGM